MNHHNDKYMEKINPLTLTGEVKEIADPVFFKSWTPDFIPDPDQTKEWRDIFELCDGIATTQDFNLTDESGTPQVGKIIFMKETVEDDPEINFTVNKNFAEHFRARRNKLLEIANAQL